VSGLGPAERAVAADLAAARFLAGCKRGPWRQISCAFPLLVVAVAAVEPDGSSGEYWFKFELSGFPGTAPEVRIWDPKTSGPLDPEKRPRGSNRITEAFKHWGNGTIYRPWDRQGGTHNNWVTTHPSLAWNPKRDLTFILEDLHGLLTSNAVAHGNRQVA
jgi:hypothetical protein